MDSVTAPTSSSTVFMSASVFNADLSKWNTAAVTTMLSSTSTPLVSVVLSFEFHSLPLLCFYVSFIFGFCPPTSSYSVQFCLCIQRGSFQVEHCGGDEHGIQYVHSSCFLLLLSLEFSLIAFVFYVFTILFLDSVHRHPPTAFANTYAFNADLSKWVTAAVTNMQQSTSTPLVFCCSFT